MVIGPLASAAPIVALAFVRHLVVGLRLELAGTVGGSQGAAANGVDMDSDAIAPELRRRARIMPRVAVERPAWLHAARFGVRRMPQRRSAGASSAQVRTDRVHARLYRSRGPASGAGLLWLHGGGFVMGDLRQDHDWCLRASAALGLTILSANYRLAPEHPFPAALDDADAAWRWLLAHAAGLGLDTRRLAIGGLSAGGGLAASLVNRLHDDAGGGAGGGAVPGIGEAARASGPRETGDHGGVQPAAQWLFSPMLDDRTAARRDLDAGRQVAWDNTANRFGWGAYLGREPGGEQQPDGAVSARRASVAGLPPTYLSVGDVDLFHAEDLAYADRLSGAGVPVTLDVVPGAPHGFQTWAPSSAAAHGLRLRSFAWLAAALAP